MGVRRLRAGLEAGTVCLTAALAGLTVMVPIDPLEDATPQSVASIDLAVFQVPRATMAAAFVTILAAVFALMMRSAVAWATITLTGIALLIDQLLWSSSIAAEATLTYIDSALAGVLMGVVGTLAWPRRATASGFLFGAMAGILLGDFTPAPAPGESPSPVDRLLLDAPSVGLSTVLVVAAGVCAFEHRRQPMTVRRLVDVVPLRSILAAGIIFPTILLTSEWFARDGRDLSVLTVGVLVIVVAATVAALFLPGRDGLLLLLMVAFAAAGSTPVTVPRPDWVVPLFVAAIGLGLYVGYRRGLPLVAAALTAVLAVASVLAVAAGVHGEVPAVVGGLAVAFVGGYCLGAATPLFPTVPPLCIAVLFVPSAAVALWGRDFERVAYSPGWYRPTEPVRALAPGLVALAITAGCTVGMLLVYRLRPNTKEAIRRRWARIRETAVATSALPGAVVVRPSRPEPPPA
ncbi:MULTISPECIES: hypothetical protein [unclassified Nocardia]|uniref:hypothetical protein n=1 Tax=unclassified Nocardia TaxID=2637762 RepID=UPI00278C5DB5|nr:MULTISPECIES: hypothetical protein [unclassified Nocardia]